MNEGSCFSSNNAHGHACQCGRTATEQDTGVRLQQLIFYFGSWHHICSNCFLCYMFDEVASIDLEDDLSDMLTYKAVP